MNQYSLTYLTDLRTKSRGTIDWSNSRIKNYLLYYMKKHIEVEHGGVTDVLLELTNYITSNLKVSRE